MATQGNVSPLSIPYVKLFSYFSSTTPVELPLGTYGSAICISGLIQGIGTIAVLVTRYGNTVAVTNILTGASLSNDYFKATVSTNGVQISTIATAASNFLAIMQLPAS